MLQCIKYMPVTACILPKKRPKHPEEWKKNAVKAKQNIALPSLQMKRSLSCLRASTNMVMRTCKIHVTLSTVTRYRPTNGGDTKRTLSFKCKVGRCDW